MSVIPELKKYSAAALANTDVAERAQDLLVAFQTSSSAFERNAAAVEEVEKSLAAAASESEQAPAALLAEFDKLAVATNQGIRSVDAAIDFINHRVPSLKEEDNIGVGVQIAVVKELTSILGLLETADEKRRFAAIGSKGAYLKARVEVEKSLLKPAKEGAAGASGASGASATSSDSAAASASSAAPQFAPSTKLLLRQIDLDAASDIARSWRILKRLAAQAALVVARNFGSLNEPRKASSNVFLG